jgi:DNA-binding transcriptional LysR family regulator
MDTRLLQQFVVLAEELHFGRAARRLHVSQPPLSKHIQQLEATMGARLFDRDRRNVRLTTAGEVLLREARAVIAQLEFAKQAVANADKEVVSRVRIGFVPAALFMDIERVFRQLRDEMPNLETVWEEMGTADQVRALQQDRIDLGFANAPQGLGGMAGHMVGRVPLRVVLPADHRLARKRAIPLAALRDETFAMVPRDIAPGYHDQVVSACYGAGFSPNIRHHAKHFLSVISLVAMGQGISIVPQTLLKAAIPGVVLQRIAPPTPEATYQVLWHPQRSLVGLGRVLEMLGVEEQALA